LTRRVGASSICRTNWGVEGPFKQEYPRRRTGKLPWWGVAWYRKHFTVPAGDSAKQVYLDIDGAMAYASVWLNGQFVGGWPLWLFVVGA